MYIKTEKKSITNLLASLKSEPQPCFEQLEINLLKSRMAIDKKLKVGINMTLMKHLTSLSQADIETKSWDKLDISDPKVREFARHIRAWTPEDPMGLFVYGIPGNAKTHMMKSLIIHNASADYSFLFLSCTTFFARCKDYVKEYFHCNDYIQWLVREHNAIVLDDLGTEKGSEFEEGNLFALFEAIAKNNRRIFMTSNLTKAELVERYHQRVVSRIGEFMIPVENKCESYRKKICKQNLEMYAEKVKIFPKNRG